ncbi:nuclear transport factor 2 family protein [Saccharothrix sp. Mg75]|uniref:nuclear transport factor 2 family protein n=1 Tax=Saccharothrix sp. Mg75 TaxID=3445357 RepID=UPI003EEAC8DD
MTGTTSPALTTALAHHRAWTSGDLDATMALVADDVVCENPNGVLRGAGAYRRFTEGFTGMLTGSALVAAFGDDGTALLMYTTDTPKAPGATAAEHLTVVDGRITGIRMVFDRAPHA